MPFPHYARSPLSSVSLSRIHLPSMLRPPGGMTTKPLSAACTPIAIPAAFSNFPVFAACYRSCAPGLYRSRSILANPAFNFYPSLAALKHLVAPPVTCSGPYAHGYFSTLQQPSEKPNAPSFTYSISASYSAKRHSLDLRQNLYTHDSYQRIVSTSTDNSWHDRKKIRPQSGQDAFFAADIGSPAEGHGVAFGVVDGVGGPLKSPSDLDRGPFLADHQLGWEESGVDPADFAHGLCDYMSMASRDYPASFGGGQNAPYPLRPLSILEMGYQQVLSEPRIHAGGSTACVGVANTQGELEVANLGDSGYAHISPLRLKYISDAQTHAFNTPFQLSKIPRRMQAQRALFGGDSSLHDMPSDATISRRTLDHGDILVFATDGVWDNLSPSDVLRLTSQVVVGMSAWVPTKSGEMIVGPDFKQLALHPTKKRFSLSAHVAAAITNAAKEASYNDNRDGPFAMQAQQVPGFRGYHGGKVDDICTLVVAACQK